MNVQFSKVQEALRWASSFLKENNRESNAAEILMCHHLNVSRATLFAMLQDEMDAKIAGEFCKDIEAFTNGTPVQYLTGYEYFYGRKFSVNSNVLIPRPETEELVQGILRRLPKSPDNFIIADICTGSGAIAITVALELTNNVTTIASDISRDALRVASQNAKSLNANVQFFEGNLLDPLIAENIKINVLISNPPYITEDEMKDLPDVVKNHEPHLALAGGQDGLDFYREIIEKIPYVKNGPMLIGFEIGELQGTQIQDMLLGAFPKAAVEVVKDINGKDRMVFAKLY